ncbi:MAG: thioredoxin family protein [Flavobacteriales bacterium]|nr:thioredoxin family protein [Flavobacteriales bacterium]
MKKNLLFAFLLVNSLLIAQNWQTNFEEAKILDQKENKNIVLVFSGSDWCAPCMKLEKNIWMSPEFQTETQNSWIIYKADFPKKKANQLSAELTEQNKKLAEKYNKDGSFPLVVLLTPSGKVLGMFGFKNISPTEYIALIHSAEK